MKQAYSKIEVPFDVLSCGDKEFIERYIESSLCTGLNELIIKESKIEPQVFNERGNKIYTSKINIVSDKEYKLLQYIKQNNIQFNFNKEE